MRKILTIDVGGTFTKYALMTGSKNFEIAFKNKLATARNSHEEFIGQLAKIFSYYSDVEGISISLPGIIDSDNGICLAAELFPFNNGRCITTELSKLCDVPVVIENDANCAALAEIKSGALTDVKDAFVLVFGSMVGGAFVRNGKIYRGAHFCAGEVSFTLKRSFSAMSKKSFYHNDISAMAFQKSCAKFLGMRSNKVSLELIFDLIDDKDIEICFALNKYAHAVAVKIFNLQMLFDPERFALGGGISERQIFIDAVNDKLNELCKDAPAYLPRPQVVACKYHNDANLFGALYRYLQK